MTYYPEIHKRKSIRLQGYDYSQNGLYFITICTKDRLCLFGKIEKWKMILNQCGNIAQQYWLEISKHFPDVILHEYVIMPNHIHGIIEINAKDHSGIEKQNHFQKIIPHSIGSIVRGYYHVFFIFGIYLFIGIECFF